MQSPSVMWSVGSNQIRSDDEWNPPTPLLLFCFRRKIKSLPKKKKQASENAQWEMQAEGSFQCNDVLLKGIYVRQGGSSIHPHSDTHTAFKFWIFGDTHYDLYICADSFFVLLTMLLHVIQTTRKERKEKISEIACMPADCLLPNYFLLLIQATTKRATFLCALGLPTISSCCLIIYILSRLGAEYCH